MATNNAINVATAASGTVLQGAGVGTAPVFSTATYPATTTVSQLLYSSATNTVTGLATANSAILATNSSGVPSITTASGNWLNTTRSSFLAVKASSTTNTTGDGTGYTVICDTEIFDQGSNYNNSTGVFTAPVTGRYYFCCNVYFNNIGVGHTSGLLQIATSNRTYFGVNNNPIITASGTATIYAMSIIADLDVNDTASFILTVSNSTKTITVFGDGTPITQFSGYLIC